MASYASPSETLEALAAEIGEAVYMEIAKWHLYLNDARLHTLLAQRLYPMVEENRLSAAAVTQVLEDITIPLGGGRRQVPLRDLLPSGCENELMRVLEDFQAKL